jgi:hypothetical protein
VIKISVIFVLTTLVLSECIGDKQMTPSPESLKNETVDVMQSPTAIYTIDNLSNCSYPEPALLKEVSKLKPQQNFSITQLLLVFLNLILMIIAM